MKSFSRFTLMLSLGIILASCNQKKFTATATERAQYEQAFNKLANIEAALADKEIEPGTKKVLLNSADKILMFGNVDQLEKEITYPVFREALQKALLVTSKMNTDSADENTAQYQTAQKSYYELQQKLRKMPPGLLQDCMNGIQRGSLQAEAIPFVVEQFKKYDFKTFLQKTIVPVSEIENTARSIDQMITQHDLNEQIQQLNELINKAQK